MRVTSRWVAFSALAWSLLLTTTRAATLTVDSESDAVDLAPGDGVCATAAGTCTLRAAVQESNAWSGPDLVVIPAGSYALTLEGAGEDDAASGDLDVRGDVMLQGQGSDVVVIDGRGLDRCIDLHAGALQAVGLTFRDGRVAGFGGGAILASAGSLELTRCVVLDCQASMGGGVALTGDARASIARCRLSGNHAVLGGGLCATGRATLAVNGSTIDDNVAIEPDDSGDGGGIYAEAGATATLANTTLSGNQAAYGAGIESSGAVVSLRNCTITSNHAVDGGGLAGLFTGSFQLANTILHGNVPDDCEETVIESLGHDLIGDAGWQCTLTGVMTGNLTGVSPLLGPLADNGGATPTHALLAGSPAIDGGSALPTGSDPQVCESDDERGIQRPQDGDGDGSSVCDIGAFEVATETGLCTDGIDNDLDGLVDCGDPDCLGSAGCADQDGDTVPDRLDCAPLDPGTFAIPPEIPRLSVVKSPARGTDAGLSWTSVRLASGSGVRHDVVTGGIRQLWSDRDFRSASCLSRDGATESATDARLPGTSGDGYWCLVEAENACGEGGYGSSFAGVPRPIPDLTCD